MVALSFSAPLSPCEVVQNLAKIEGPLDVYCWYEGKWASPKRERSL